MKNLIRIATMADLVRKLNNLETTLLNANNYALSLEKRIIVLETKMKN